MATPSDWTIVIPLVASLMGAGVGAWTAQYIAARNKRNDERLKEIRAASAATTIAYGITDHFLSMKQQIVKPTIEKFAMERERFVQADAAPKQPGLTVITFNVPLDTFRFNWSPSKDLQDIVFKDLSAPIRPVIVVPILSRTISMLEKLADDRNAMVKDFHEAQKAGKEINPYAYYGVPFPNGGADQRYTQTLQHIFEYTDDAIKFSQIVGDDLREYALALRETLPRSMQALAPRIATISFPTRADMMPRADKYNNLEHAYLPIRVLGSGWWCASFEALALAQYDHQREYWIS